MPEVATSYNARTGLPAIYSRCFDAILRARKFFEQVPMSSNSWQNLKLRNRPLPVVRPNHVLNWSIHGKIRLIIMFIALHGICRSHDEFRTRVIALRSIV